MGRKNVILLSLAVIALVTLGLVMLTSTGVGNGKPEGYQLVKKQGLFIMLGLILLAFNALGERKKRLKEELAREQAEAELEEGRAG